MTDVIIRDPNDTGDIPRPIGEDRTVILRTDLGEATQNLGEYVMTTPSFDAIPRRIIEIDDTVTFRIPETIGVVDTGRLTILDSLAGSYADMDGELQGPQKPPPPLPKPRPAAPGRASFTVRGMVRQGRHRKPAPAWTRWAIGVGTLAAVWSAAMLAVIR
jgi:hypothetical protein